MKNKEYTCDTHTGICKPTEIETKQLDNNIKNNKIKITYYYDALCGWCYGFKNEFKEFVSNNKNSIDFEVISGGLFLNNRVGYINKVAPYVKAGAYKTVEEVSGIKFGSGFINKLLGKGDVMLNSLPPAIALAIVKNSKPQKSLEFAELLLTAVYQDGINIEDINDYIPYLKTINFDFIDFSNKMKNPIYKELANNDFKNFVDHKINGMPTLVIEYQNKKTYLSNGFATSKELEKRLKIFLTE